MIIKGKKNKAVVYAKVIEDNAIEQIRTLCNQEFSEGSKIRVMPDVHTGTGCTIGMTMTVTDKVVPNIVGVDIGCGMLTVNLGKEDIDLDAFDVAVHRIPAGREVYEGRQRRFNLSSLLCYRELKDTRRIGKSLGTLGGGNHFIEIDRASDGTNYLVIHTGSRNLGKQVAEYYQDLAIQLQRGKASYLKRREAMISQYKKEGRKAELYDALQRLTWEPNPLTIPEDLCFLSGKYVDDYLHDVRICQDFAVQNRELIAEKILSEMKIAPIDFFHTVHNYIDVEEMIIRKGAIAAHKGEKVLIPINMRDGSILAIGRGNSDWNQSAPHGAGRILSRSDAKAQLSIDEYQREMEGIYSTSVCENTLDESPMAYKSINDIIDVVKESVDVIDVMKPIYNFKAMH